MSDGWIVKPEGWEYNNILYDINRNSIDLIIVLGGGLDSDGRVHEWVKRRLDRAFELHKIYNATILCCGGGTYHKPPFTNDKGFVVHESTESVNYLIQKSVLPNRILKEWSSYDTIANAYFSFTNHVLCREEWKNIAVITSYFHMERTKEIFNWIYKIFETKFNRNFDIIYYSVSDIGLDKNMIKDRKDRESNSLNNIKLLSDRIKTVNELHKWLFTEHNAYNNRSSIHEEIDCVGSY